MRKTDTRGRTIEVCHFTLEADAPSLALSGPASTAHRLQLELDQRLRGWISQAAHTVCHADMNEIAGNRCRAPLFPFALQFDLITVCGSTENANPRSNKFWSCVVRCNVSLAAPFCPEREIGNKRALRVVGPGPDSRVDQPRIERRCRSGQRADLRNDQ